MTKIYIPKSLFAETVIEVVKSIPKGKTLSYKRVATMAGRPGASRAVGNLMKKNLDKSVPCHRVIYSNGKAGGYNGLKGDKANLLKEERAVFRYL